MGVRWFFHVRYGEQCTLYMSSAQCYFFVWLGVWRCHTLPHVWHVRCCSFFFLFLADTRPHGICRQSSVPKLYVQRSQMDELPWMRQRMRAYLFSNNGETETFVFVGRSFFLFLTLYAPKVPEQRNTYSHSHAKTHAHRANVSLCFDDVFSPYFSNPISGAVLLLNR